MKTPSTQRQITRLALVAVAAFGAASSAHAADGTWNVDAGGLWSTPGNWASNIIANDLTSTANFTNDITADRTVRIDSDRTLNKLVFSDSATATAGSWLVDNNGVSTNNLVLSGTTGAATGTAPVIDVGALGSGKTATISAIIQGSYGLTKAGSGTLVLSGANTYTGGSNLNEGVVRLGNNNALNTTGDITFGGGTLQFSSQPNLGARFKSTSAIRLDMNGQNVLTAQSGIVSSNTNGMILTNSGDTTSIASGGTLMFNATNSFTGGISVGDKVRLRLQTTAAAINNNTVSVQSGGQLLMNSALTITNDINIAGAGWAGDNDGVTFGQALGAIRFNSGTTSDIQGTVTLTAAATISASAVGPTYVTQNAGTISGKITGNHALTIGAGAGTLPATAATGKVTLSSGLNDYTGKTTVATGTLALAGSGTIATSSGIEVASGAILDVTAGGLALGASQTLSGKGTVLATGKTVTASGTISPGSSPGTLTQDGGTLSLAAGANYNWQVHNAGGAAGVGYDTYALINGATLNLASLTSLNPYNINLWSLSAISPSDVNGLATNFDYSNTYTWTLFSTGTAITGFSADQFDINVGATNGTGGFANAVAGFTVELGDSSTDLVLKYTPVPEPTTTAFGLLALVGLLLRRRR